MLDKLISAGVFGLVFVVVLNAMYRNRKFLENNYVNRFNKTTKIIIYIISLVAIMIILVSTHITGIPAALYAALKAVCWAINAGLLFSVFWGKED